MAHNKALDSAVRASFKDDLSVRHPSEEVFFAFGKQFKLRQAPQIARPILRKLCETLCEEAVSVASDFENEVRHHLIAPGVVIEELRINMYLGVLLWRRGIRG